MGRPSTWFCAKASEADLFAGVNEFAVRGGGGVSSFARYPTLSKGGKDGAPKAFGGGPMPTLLDAVEGAGPAGFVEDVDAGAEEGADAEAQGGGLLVHLLCGGVEGPVVEQGAAKDVFSGDEAPEAAV